VGAACPGCERPAAAPFRTCPRCSARHHEACWAARGDCAAPGCGPVAAGAGEVAVARAEPWREGRCLQPRCPRWALKGPYCKRHTPRKMVVQAAVLLLTAVWVGFGLPGVREGVPVNPAPLFLALAGLVALVALERLVRAAQGAARARRAASPR